MLPKLNQGVFMPQTPQAKREKETIFETEVINIE
jgi:hypothetical protein